MISSEVRSLARKKLQGKWGKAVFNTLVYFSLWFILGIVSNFFNDNWIITVISWIIEIPMTFGLSYTFFNLYHDFKDSKSLDFWNLGFNNFGRSWSIAFTVIRKMIVPIIIVIVGNVLSVTAFFQLATSSFHRYYYFSSVAQSAALLLIISAIILLVGYIWLAFKSYYYQLSFYVAFDNPDMLPKDCVARSEELMTNNRAKLFGLQLSFIGWALLGVVTLFIGYLWLTPYISFATIVFYDYLAHGIDGNVQVVNNSDVIDNAINIDSISNSDDDNPIK